MVESLFVDASNATRVLENEPPNITLTPRQRQVLELLLVDMSNKEIAAALHIAERTIESHLTKIYAKLGVNSRCGAIVWALKHGKA